MLIMDAHEKPPASLRPVFKKYQRITEHVLSTDEDVIDFRLGLRGDQTSAFQEVLWQDENALMKNFECFMPKHDLLRDYSSQHRVLKSYRSLEIPGIIKLSGCICTF